MGAKARRKTFVMACKTFRRDSASFDRMITSFHTHNKENIHLVVSVPEEDVPLFAKYQDDNVSVIADESYAEKYFTKEMHWGLSFGYINQEICKLSFWETGIGENYLFVDSDTYFIRDFSQSDFMRDDGTPYSVLTQDKDLQVQSYYIEYGRERRERIRRIFEAVGLTDGRLLTCHGMTVLNSTVLQDMKKSFMEPHKYRYDDLIRISPFEYSWYNAWLQKSQIIPVLAVEPFFKTFHMRQEYQFWRTGLISQEDIATQYVGVILNSNWRPIAPPERYENPGKMSVILNKIIRKWG
jgi:hypothetical protein